MAVAMAVLIAAVPWLAPDELAPQTVQASTVSGAWAPAGDALPVEAMAASTAHPYWQLPAWEVDAFDRIAQCESGGDWSIHTGNGYGGGLQFLPSSWRGVGGEGEAWQASREEQIYRGHLIRLEQGWQAWPVCSRRAGLR